jgi:hypothetical protein
MPDEDRELTREELEDENGEPLPRREVMSTIDPETGLFVGMPIKPEVIPIDDPHPEVVDR